jgi:hypothetical protein
VERPTKHLNAIGFSEIRYTATFRQHFKKVGVVILKVDGFPLPAISLKYDGEPIDEFQLNERVVVVAGENLLEFFFSFFNAKASQLYFSNDRKTGQAVGFHQIIGSTLVAQIRRGSCNVNQSETIV